MKKLNFALSVVAGLIFTGGAFAAATATTTFESSFPVRAEANFTVNSVGIAQSQMITSGADLATLTISSPYANQTFQMNKANFTDAKGTAGYLTYKSAAGDEIVAYLVGANGSKPNVNGTGGNSSYSYVLPQNINVKAKDTMNAVPGIYTNSITLTYTQP